MGRIGVFIAFAVRAATMGLITAGSAASAATGPASIPPAHAEAVAAFQERVREHVALHRKMEATLPHLPKQATPEEVDRHQRALGDRIHAARRDAKPGEFFTPGMRALVKQALVEVLSGPDGRTIRASIMDENPGVPAVVLDERYPAAVPLSTMPPQVLAALPKLPEELEYRFLGPRLILLDTHANIVVDYTGDVMPP